MTMKHLLIALLICISTNLFSQSMVQDDELFKRKSLTIGILQGGGSLVGADLEVLLTNNLGLQVGGGFIGFGAGLNYHLKPSIRSSFISLQYWHQGIGENFAQSALGPAFVYRGKKWFTFQIGIAAPLDEGPGMPEDFEQPPVMLTYSIGAYFPF